MSSAISLERGSAEFIIAHGPANEHYHEFIRHIPRSEIEAINKKMTRLKDADRFMLQDSNTPY